MKIICGSIRQLDDVEKDLDICRKHNYTWVVEEPYEYHDESIGVHVTVPRGFLTDGASGAPDKGCSWIFHDYLYATHCFDGPIYCTREDADDIMKKILEKEDLDLYRSVVSLFTSLNPFWIFSRAWESSGQRGPQFLEEDTFLI